VLNAATVAALSAGLRSEWLYPRDNAVNQGMIALFSFPRKSLF
jgi:hypothetical protein